MNIYHLLLKLFFIIIVMGSFGHSYTVKLAVYKNYEGLKQLIGQLDYEKDQQEILISKKNGLYYVSSKSFKHKDEANSALLRYKKVFLDAYIIQKKRVHVSHTIKEDTAHPLGIIKEKKAHSYKANDILKKYLLKEINTKVPTYKFINFDDIWKKNNNKLLSEKLSQNWVDQIKINHGIFYVRYLEGSTKIKNKIMEFSFKKNNLMYKDILDKKSIVTHALYKTNKNNMLIYSKYSNVFIENHIEKVMPTYLLVTLYMNKRRITEAKYYFNRHDVLMEEHKP